ncbi:MAG: hypothetical protein ACQEWG_09845 [Bacteroidota bacterium]
MKKINLIISTVLSMFVLAACEKSEDVSAQEIDGTYVGILTGFDNAKSETGVNESAIAEIRKSGKELIEVHLYSHRVDTTFMMNYYEHNIVYWYALTEMTLKICMVICLGRDTSTEV